MNELEVKIAKGIIAAIESDKLVLPTLPEVALRVRDVAENSESGMAELTDVISNDAALTARIIRVANSPLLRGAREISNLSMAVNRLGMDYTANLAIGLAMEQMFQATSEMIDKRMRQVWQSSTEVAGIAHVLAQHYTNIKPDQATLAGLVHQIGVLPILTFVENEAIDVDANALERIIEKLHPKIGVRILRQWDFSKDFQRVPLEHRKFDRQAQSADLVDVVMIARLQSLIGTEHPDTQLDWSQISAFERLGLDPDIDMNEAEDLSAEMEAAMALLQA